MERILIKISGACLKDNKSDAILSHEKLNDLAKQIKDIAKKYSVSIVVGGGNIWRGSFNHDLKLNRNQADNMGVLATIINSLSLQNVLQNNGVNAKVFSAIECNDTCDKFQFEKVNEFLNNKNSVAILAGGTGNSFFSTDTAAALRASQLDIKKILMGKNGVDGVYSADPKSDKKAVHYKQLSYGEIIVKKLKVMDLTALTMCDENKIELIVFNIDRPNAIVDVLDNKIQSTKIC